jgi:hypothetical protein
MEGRLRGEVSLARGGPLHRLLAALGLGERHSGGRAALFAAVAWLPLFVLSAVDGQAPSLLVDPVVATRFLFALPLLVAVELPIDTALGQALASLDAAGLITDPQRPRFAAAARATARLRDSLIAEGLCLAGALALGLLGVHDGAPVASWALSARHLAPLGSTASASSLAGRYSELVSQPLLLLIALRWLWRITLWTLLLWRSGRRIVTPAPLHPDRMGGLRFLAFSHVLFAPIALAVAAMVAAGLGARMVRGGESLSSLRDAIIVTVVLLALLFVMPLFGFVPALGNAKRRALAEYGAWCGRYALAYERRWLHTAGPVPLANEAVSTHCDLGHSFATVDGMAILPVDRRALAVLVVAAALPMLPLVALQMPLTKVLREVLSALR